MYSKEENILTWNPIVFNYTTSMKVTIKSHAGPLSWTFKRSINWVKRPYHIRSVAKILFVFSAQNENSFIKRLYCTTSLNVHGQTIVEILPFFGIQVVEKNICGKRDKNITLY